MEKHRKFYGVRVGRKDGVFNSWEETKSLVDKYPGAIYKSFSNYADAFNFAYPVQEYEPSFIAAQVEKKESGSAAVHEVTAYTDGSFMDGIAGWGYLLLEDGVVLCEACGSLEEHFGGRNITSEIEAAKQAIQKAYDLGFGKVTVVHDYAGVGCWPDGAWQANKSYSKEYCDFVVHMRKTMDICFVKVKGHSNDFFNNKADRLAAAGTKHPVPVFRWSD